MINAMAASLFTPEGPTVNPQYQPQQRTWNQLTLAEVKAAYDQHAKYQEEDMGVSGWVEFAAAIEAKLKENT